MKVIVEVPIDDSLESGSKVIGRIAVRLGLTRHMAKRAVAKAVRAAVKDAIKDHAFFKFVSERHGRELVFTTTSKARMLLRIINTDSPLEQASLTELGR